MIIGGANIYEQVMAANIVDEIFLTRVHIDIEGDAFFPRFSKDDWQCLEEERHQADDRHEYDYTFYHYMRKPRY